MKAEKLGKKLEDLAYEVSTELNEAIKNIANAAYAGIVATAQLQLHSTQKDYIKGLDFQTIGENSYLITLEGEWPNALEKGFAGFDLKEWMLKSEKIVEVGPRAGKPWVQHAVDGHKFAHVPFEHNPFSKAAASGDLNQAIRKLTAFNKSGIEQKFTSLFNDEKGNPLEGRVASVQKVKGFPELDGITKYQKKYKNEATGSESIHSVYMTYRTVSENGSGFQHPGFAGLKAFDENEKWIDEQVDLILEKLLK